jgi:hypothetical protein
LDSKNLALIASVSKSVPLASIVILLTKLFGSINVFAGTCERIPDHSF